MKQKTNDFQEIISILNEINNNLVKLIKIFDNKQDFIQNNDTLNPKAEYKKTIEKIKLNSYQKKRKEYFIENIRSVAKKLSYEDDGESTKIIINNKIRELGGKLLKDMSVEKLEILHQWLTQNMQKNNIPKI